MTYPNGNGKPYQQRIDELQKVLDATRAELAAAQADAKTFMNALNEIRSYKVFKKLDNGWTAMEIIGTLEGIAEKALSAAGADAEMLDTRGGA